MVFISDKGANNMQINNSNPSLNFGCIRVNNGGLERLQKEGLKSLEIFNEAQQTCKRFSWHLNINSDGYQLYNPATKQTYSEPFSVKRNFAKGLFIVRMKNGNNNTVAYSIPFSKENISFWYKSIRNATGIDKMIKILNILERRNHV